jgi:4-hydroxyphenylpyruvate dioxygenase
VQRVDCPNFGLCLDTFNIADRVWGDPTSVTGKTANADADLKASIEQRVRTVDLSKVFYIQVVDAERQTTPLVKGHPFHVDSQPPRMSWSRNARAFAYEENKGAYLPVEYVAQAIIHQMGYKGVISMELFRGQ